MSVTGMMAWGVVIALAIVGLWAAAR